VPRETNVDALLEGWRDRRVDPDGLAWLAGRVAGSPATLVAA
jgi:hypothetical protein